MTALAELDGTALAIARALDLQVDELYAGGADIYDALVDGDGTEIAELIAAARGLRGDVLDLGCGSGRLSVPFLLRGHGVTGVDDSAAMLDRFRRKAQALPARARAKLTLVEADMAALDLGRSFDVILLATTTVTLLSPGARARALEAARAHLAPGGRFLISTLDVWAGGPSEDVRLVAGDGVLLTVIERRDPEAGVRHVSILEQRPEGMRLLHSRPRLVAEDELVADLGAAGLAVVARTALGGGVVLLVCEARS